MKISQILDKIDDKQLFVPAFQREYVWKKDDTKSLVDSLIKAYPTGTMLTWQTTNPPELKGAHKYNEMQGAVLILLDGQQRITTLYMLIRGEIPPYYTAPEILSDNRGLYVNMETLELEYYQKTKMAADPRWQDITEIFKKSIRARDVEDALLDKGEPVDKSRRNRIEDNFTTIQSIVDREFPEQVIPTRASIRDAIDIFYKVNASGVALTDAELALAQISGYWPKARDAFKAKLAELGEQGFVFRLDFIVYVLLGCLHQMGSDMRRLHGSENDAALRSAWQRLSTQVLDYVVNVMRQHAFVDHSEEINSDYALVPIIVYCFRKNGAHLNDTEIGRLIKWFYYSQIRNRYVSQLPQKLDRDLKIVCEDSNPFDTLLKVIEEERPLEVRPDEFVGHGIRHPLYSMMIWYFKSRGALCLTTGLKIHQTMGKKYRLERDHIFPYSLLKKHGYGQSNSLKYKLAQEMTNRAILTQVANREKSSKDPAGYLAEVREQFPQGLGLQSIPDDPMLWKIENYEEFLAARRKALAGELNGFLSGITTTTAIPKTVSLEEIIADGENEEVEFKSSARWDYQLEQPNKKLEDVIVKTVAAFGNREGGMLLIGVKDDGTLLGLDRDFGALAGADKDKYELYLRNLLNERIGKAFTAKSISVAFPEVNGVMLCQIEVRGAAKPIFIKVPDKNGTPVEKFFVRSGNSSQDLSPSETQVYIAQRFA